MKCNVETCRGRGRGPGGGGEVKGWEGRAETKILKGKKLVGFQGKRAQVRRAEGAL